MYYQLFVLFVRLARRESSGVDEIEIEIEMVGN
jgi:hypothetical protein